MMPHLLRYLRYVKNTGGCTVAQFDDDWEPIGPSVRRDIMPRYVINQGEKLMLTEAGEEELTEGGRKE